MLGVDGSEYPESRVQRKNKKSGGKKGRDEVWNSMEDLTYW